jgi:peptidoglycan/LPS O-acetylase OafA/YrhL
MFRGFSIFIPTQGYDQPYTRHGTRGRGWRLMVPGLGLICAALAMIIWPELLAYFVASLLLCGGTVLLMVGWRMRQREQSARRPMSSVSPLDLSNRED